MVVERNSKVEELYKEYQSYVATVEEVEVQTEFLIANGMRTLVKHLYPLPIIIEQVIFYPDVYTTPELCFRDWANEASKKVGTWPFKKAKHKEAYFLWQEMRTGAGRLPKLEDVIVKGKYVTNNKNHCFISQDGRHYSKPELYASKSMFVDLLPRAHMVKGYLPLGTELYEATTSRVVKVLILDILSCNLEEFVYRIFCDDGETKEMGTLNAFQGELDGYFFKDINDARQAVLDLETKEIENRKKWKEAFEAKFKKL